MSGNWWFSSVKNWQQIKMLNVGHFYTIFHSFFCRPLLKKSPFLWFTMKKIVVFQLSHNTTPNQDKLRRFSSSVRGPKKAGEVRDDMSTSLILRSSNLYTDLGTRFMASIWRGWWIRIFSLTIWYNCFVGCSDHSAILKDWTEKSVYSWVYNRCNWLYLFAMLL